VERLLLLPGAPKATSIWRAQQKTAPARTGDPFVSQFDGAVIREQGVTFAIALVQEHVLDSPTERENAARGFTAYFGVPTVLMSERRQRTFGRPDIVRFLESVSPSQIPWKRYTAWTFPAYFESLEDLMVLYKDKTHVSYSDNAAFDAIHEPGSPTPFSGIYRCVACGREDVSVESRPLPPQNHHQHAVAQGRIRWRMQMYAQHQGSW
jgi:hypothetical protein